MWTSHVSTATSVYAISRGEHRQWKTDNGNRHKQSTTNTRQPYKRRPGINNNHWQRHPTIYTTVSTRHSTTDTWQPTINTYRCQIQPTINTNTLQPTPNSWQGIENIRKHSRRSPPRNPLSDRSSASADASFVTNVKPTTTDRHRHCILFIDIVTLSVSNLSSTTTSRQESTSDNWQCRSLNSLSNMSNSPWFRPVLAYRIEASVPLWTFKVGHKIRSVIFLQLCIMELYFPL